MVVINSEYSPNALEKGGECKNNEFDRPTEHWNIRKGEWSRSYKSIRTFLLDSNLTVWFLSKLSSHFLMDSAPISLCAALWVTTMALITAAVIAWTGLLVSTRGLYDQRESACRAKKKKRNPCIHKFHFYELDLMKPFPLTPCFCCICC